MRHKKKHGPAPVPPGNLPQAGPSGQDSEGQANEAARSNKEPFQEQDPKRRLGNFSGKGEHPYQQPGGLNDANH